MAGPCMCGDSECPRCGSGGHACSNCGTEDDSCVDPAACAEAIRKADEAYVESIRQEDEDLKLFPLTLIGQEWDGDLFPIESISYTPGDHLK